MPILQTLRDRLLARAVRLTARVEESRRPPPADAARLEAEAVAYGKALAALDRQDVNGALAALAPIAATALKAGTLLLNAQVLLSIDATEEAIASLERAMALEPSDAAVLDALATLRKRQGNFAEEWRVRRQQLLAVADLGPREAIDAVAALVRAVSRGSELADADLELVTRRFDRIAAAASTEQRAEFAEWLFRIKPGRAPARALMERNIPKELGWGTRVLALSSHGDLPAGSVLRLHEKADEALNNVWLRAAELSNAGVIPDYQWSPWSPRNGKILRGYATRNAVPARLRPGSVLLMENTRQLLVRLPVAEPRRVEGVAVLVGSADDRHLFMVDHLSRLATLEALGIAVEGAQWVVGKNLLPYQREYFSILGIPAERLLPIDAHDNVVFAHLIAPTPLGRGARQISALMPRWAREVLALRAGARLSAQPVRRVYLSTPAGTGGHISNEAALVASLESQGFEHFRENDLSVSDLIRLLAQSCELVAALGPSLTHMLFMPEGGRITALHNSHLPVGSEGLEFDYLARACRHRLQAVSGLPTGGPDGRDGILEYEVPLDDLVSALEPR